MANTRNIRSNAKVFGTLEATGNAVLGGDVSVAGDANLADDVAIGGDTVIQGNLNVIGSVSFGAGSTFNDSTFDVHDEGDITKKVIFDITAATTGTTTTLVASQTANRLVTLPDADAILVGTLAAQTLTNKTIDADANTISNIDNADIKLGAAIDRAKLALGSADEVVINDPTGALSSEPFLDPVRGGLGVDASAFSGIVRATAGVFSAASNIVNADIDAAAAIARAKIAAGTANHVIINSGAGLLSSEASLLETRGGTAQTSYTTGDTLYASASNTLSKRAIGVDGQISKVSASGLPAWEDAVDPSREVRIYEDWIGDSTGSQRWLTLAVGAGAGEATITSQITSGHPGVVQFNTGTTATGISGRNLGGVVAGNFTSGLIVGGGKIIIESMVRVEDLSTAGERFNTLVGLIQGVTITDGIFIRYLEQTSANWQLASISASTSTLTDSGVPVVADQWYKLRIEINAAGTSIDYYIDNVAVGTITTNIPTVAIAPVIRHVKQAGTTPRLAYVDYYKLFQRFTSAR